MVVGALHRRMVKVSAGLLADVVLWLLAQAALPLTCYRSEEKNWWRRTHQKLPSGSVYYAGRNSFDEVN